MPFYNIRIQDWKQCVCLCLSLSIGELKIHGWECGDSVYVYDGFVSVIWPHIDLLWLAQCLYISTCKYLFPLYAFIHMFAVIPLMQNMCINAAVIYSWYQNTLHNISIVGKLHGICHIEQYVRYVVSSLFSY